MEGFRAKVLAAVLVFIIPLNQSADSEHNFSEALCNTSSNSTNQYDGVCISILQKIQFCPLLFSLLENESFGKLQEHLCDENLRNPKVCCSLNSYFEGVHADKEAFIFSSHRNYNLVPHEECGKTENVDRILSGRKALPGQYPWMIRIGTRDVNGVTFSCGGSIISQRYVLTAAHCFKDLNEIFNLLIVRLADTDDSLNPEEIKISDFVIETASYIDMTPEQVILHPGYDGTVGSKHDIALVRLKENINITSGFTKPICLPFLKEYKVKRFENSLRNETKFWRNPSVAGWGKTINSEDNLISSTLQFSRVSIRPLILCQSLYWSLNINDSQICAGGNDDGDSCQGDSGSPLYDAAIAKRSLKFFQIGIVSFGRSTCGKTPSVHTRVRNYLKWILDNIKH